MKIHDHQGLVALLQALDPSVLGQGRRQHRKLVQARAAMRRLVYNTKSMRLNRLFRWSREYARAESRLRQLNVVLNRRIGGAS